MKLKMHWAVEAYMPFRSKEKEGRGLRFSRESRQFTGRRKNKFLQSHPETMGHKGETGLVRFLPVCLICAR